MCPKRTSTTPSADRSHAAYVACRAARVARESFGADEAAATRVYADAYAEAMRG